MLSRLFTTLAILCALVGGSIPGAGAASHDRPRVTVVTANVDWAHPSARAANGLERLKPRADLIVAQETKKVDVRRALGRDWQARQNPWARDKRNSAVAWDRARARGSAGGYVVGTRPRGVRMLTRWIAWNVVRIDHGQKIIVASAHRPPARYARLWRGFDRHVEAWVRYMRGRFPVVLGTDWNSRHVLPFERATGLRWHGCGIIGFFVDPRLDVLGATRCVRFGSDHPAAVLDLRL